MWRVEIEFGGQWITLASGYAKRDDAEWAVGQWKQAHDIRDDSIFRYSQAPAPAPAAKKYEARMYGVGYSAHATGSAAKAGLAKMRKAYRNTRAGMPYPQQTITCEGKVIYTA